MFRQLCGTNPLRKVILATTMWDEVGRELGDKREGDLKTIYWKFMIDKGSKVLRYTRTVDSARTVLDHFLPKVANSLPEPGTSSHVTLGRPSGSHIDAPFVIVVHCLTMH
jgi:hypothetical protein